MGLELITPLFWRCCDVTAAKLLEYPDGKLTYKDAFLSFIVK